MNGKNVSGKWKQQERYLNMNKVECRAKCIKGDKKCYFILLIATVHKLCKNIVSIYAPIEQPHTEQKLQVTQGDINRKTITIMLSTFLLNCLSFLTDLKVFVLYINSI